ncbi:MAG TPA: hypothetical protein PLT50_04485 [bacterium]|nr:hypothetical protein [bacterium]
MAEKVKKQFYRIGSKAQSFSDSISGLQVTKHLPGFCYIKTSVISNALAGGHIIAITEEEYNTLCEKYKNAPTTELSTAAVKAKAAGELVGKSIKTPEEKISKPVETATLSREEMESQLEEFELGTKEKKRLLNLSDEELNTWLEAQK